MGRKCSNPNCRKLTCGANTDPDKITNIGVASHICAAVKCGSKYDESMTAEERKSFDNRIWLRQSCSKLIDIDTARYTKEVLLRQKKIAEELPTLEVRKIVRGLTPMCHLGNRAAHKIGI